MPAVLGGLCGALLPASESLAACAPATGNNITVTCTGTTTNQGPGTNTGYGDSTQNGVTVNVQSGASVLGTSTGIDLNNNNIINNSGTIATNGGGGIGNVNGISTNGPLTVNNSGTIGVLIFGDFIDSDSAGINTFGSGLVVTNTSTGVIQGATAIQGGGTPSTMTVTNSGLISGLLGGGGNGIIADTLTLTNNASGTITADGNAVQANTATIYNYGTISAPTSGSGGTAVNVNALTLVNYASGVITGDGFGVSGSQTPVLTVTNFGTISGIGLGAAGIEGNAVFLMNSGTVSVPVGSAISMDHGTVVNNVGGTITGDFDTIAAFHNTTIFNAGTITSSGGPAIFFTAGGGGNTLTIAPTSVINGNVVASGTDTFQLGGPGSGTFDLGLIGTQYQGFATYNKVDASTWMLTGAGNQVWNVDAGTLLVNGDLSAASGITVNPGGTLGGTGVLPTTNVNGGVFAPGPATGPGTVTVTGNLNFQAGSTYLVHMSPSTAATANVSGTAALAGTVLASLQPGSYVTRSYTIMTANGGFGGSTFNALAFSPGGFGGTLSYTPTTVVLGLTSQLGRNGGLGQNQQNVANAINNFFNNGGALPPAFFNIFGLAGANLASALSQLSGEAATGAQQSAFQLMDEFLNFMIDPLLDGGGNTGSAGGQAMGFAPEQAALPPDAALAYAAVLKAPPRSFEQLWSIRGGAYGGYNRTEGDPSGLGTHDLSARAGGFAGALDYHLSHDSVIGVAVAGGDTNWGLTDGLGGGRSNATQVGVYGKTRNGPAYLAGSLAYTWHAVDTDRLVLGDQVSARFNAESFGGRLEGGYRLAWPVAAVIPYAAVQAQSFSTPSYSETDFSGGGFGLAFAARTATDTRSELGTRFERVVAVAPTSVLALKARLAWAHDWVSDPTLAATFETLPGASFTVNGAAPAKDSALATAGAELRLLDGVSVLGKLDGEFASHASTYAGSGVIRYVW
jgi:uncharacterized protein with beta-barrel porin domain